ncbi:MAG: response regulator, partial [Flavobacteriaceae bacterium]|nr:response regulator [Flavobacteriaceae bacterium]
MPRILIIEDEAAIRRVLVKILAEENDTYEVFEAEDGLRGIEMLKKEDYDLVLCDIKMPKMDGVEV